MYIIFFVLFFFSYIIVEKDFLWICW